MKILCATILILLCCTRSLANEYCDMMASIAGTAAYMHQNGFSKAETYKLLDDKMNSSISGDLRQVIYEAIDIGYILPIQREQSAKDYIIQTVRGAYYESCTRAMRK